MNSRGGLPRQPNETQREEAVQCEQPYHRLKSQRSGEVSTTVSPQGRATAGAAAKMGDQPTVGTLRTECLYGRYHAKIHRPGGASRVNLGREEPPGGEKREPSAIVGRGGTEGSAKQNAQKKQFDGSSRTDGGRGL